MKVDPQDQERAVTEKTLPELEKAWRDAAEDQAEARREFDKTAKQVRESGRELSAEPAAIMLGNNLQKAIERYRDAFEALMRAVRGE